MVTGLNVFGKQYARQKRPQHTDKLYVCKNINNLGTLGNVLSMGGDGGSGCAHGDACRSNRPLTSHPINNNAGTEQCAQFSPARVRLARNRRYQLVVMILTLGLEGGALTWAKPKETNK